MSFGLALKHCAHGWVLEAVGFFNGILYPRAALLFVSDDTTAASAGFHGRTPRESILLNGCASIF